MKIEEKHSRGGSRLRWNDTVRRDMKAWTIREEWNKHGSEKWEGFSSPLKLLTLVTPQWSASCPECPWLWSVV